MGTLLLVVAYVQTRAYADLPVPRLALSTTGDFGWPGDVLGVAEDGRILGLPSRIEVSPGEAPSWLGLKEQCRLALLRTAIAVGHSRATTRRLPRSRRSVTARRTAG